ncbi:hypothetical protein ABZ372_51510, partial [Streptomyces sp. NPDC005921]
ATGRYGDVVVGTDHRVLVGDVERGRGVPLLGILEPFPQVDGLTADLDKALTTTGTSAYTAVARSVIDSRYWFSIGSLNTTLLTVPGITGTRKAQNLLEYNVLHFAALGRS